MARAQTRSRASKLARLVNSEASMTRFRELYRVPSSIRLAYCNLDDLPVINKDEILLPIMAVVEGGVRFPLHPLLVNLLLIVNATPSQVSLNFFRIIMGVVALNRILGVNLRVGEIFQVYQYVCPGEESRTLCHLKAKNIHNKLVNGLPDTNKGYDKDYLRVSGDWYTDSKCRSDFGSPDSSRIALYEGQADTDLVPRFRDLKRYGWKHLPPVWQFQQTQQLSLKTPSSFPVGQVSEMAPPINPFELMARGTGGSSSGTAKTRGKGRGKGSGKKGQKVVSDSSSSEQAAQTTVQEPPRPLPVVHEIDESDHGEDLAPPKKKGRSEAPPMPAEGASGQLRTAHVAHGLARAACLPGDMNQWDSMNSAQIFRHGTRGLMMATQSALAMESRVLKMTDELQRKSADYKKLEDQHFANINMMKEAETLARAEAESRKKAEALARAEEENRKKAEAELAELREKVRKLESECITSIEKAIEDGKVLGKVEGEKSGYEGAMEEARTQFRMVFNTGFRKGWKSALTKTEQPETSELFLRSNTPIPYPEEGLQDSDNEAPEAGEEEADDEDEEDDEVEEGTETGRTQEAPQSAPVETAADCPGPSSGK
uniref:Uncharacterized protein n=1 Tax=Fagus sylvatica TaxID=28930 RepID=A0A2N9EX39_FAGSY